MRKPKKIRFERKCDRCGHLWQCHGTPHRCPACRTRSYDKNAVKKENYGWENLEIGESIFFRFIDNPDKNIARMLAIKSYISRTGKMHHCFGGVHGVTVIRVS